MPAMPWKTFRTAEPGREYLALVTALPLRSYLAIPRFLRFTRQVLEQMSHFPGLVGYALLARPLRKQFWTLSVWESERTLTDFVRSAPHRAVMAALQPDMRSPRFVRWTIRGEAYPPAWEDALARAAPASPGSTPSA